MRCGITHCIRSGVAHDSVSRSTSGDRPARRGPYGDICGRSRRHLTKKPAPEDRSGLFIAHGHQRGLIRPLTDMFDTVGFQKQRVIMVSSARPQRWNETTVTM